MELYVVCESVLIKSVLNAIFVKITLMNNNNATLAARPVRSGLQGMGKMLFNC